MRKIYFLLCFIVVLSSCFSQKQLFDRDIYLLKGKKSSYCDYTYSFFKDYFNIKPKDRYNYLLLIKDSLFVRKLNISNKPISFQTNLPLYVGSVITEDVKVLSKNVINIEYTVGQDNDFVILTSYDKLEQYKDIYNLSLNYRYEIDTAFLSVVEIEDSYLEYIFYYVKNSPERRIYFLEYYLDLIPIDVIKLFKSDLDNIFEVETPIFWQKNKINNNKFYEAKRIWLSNIK